MNLLDLAMEGRFASITPTMSSSSSSSNSAISSNNKRKLEGILLKRQEEDDRQRTYLMRLHDLKQQQQEQLYRSHLLPFSLSPTGQGNDTTVLYGYKRKKRSYYDYKSDEYTGDEGHRAVLDLLDDNFVEPSVARHMTLSKSSNTGYAEGIEDNEDSAKIMRLMMMGMPPIPDVASASAQPTTSSSAMTAASDSTASSPIPPPPQWNYSQLSSDYFQRFVRLPRYKTSGEQASSTTTEVSQAAKDAVPATIFEPTPLTAQEESTHLKRSETDEVEPIVPITRLVAATSSSSMAAKSGSATTTTLGSVSRVCFDENTNETIENENDYVEPSPVLLLSDNPEGDH